MYSILYAYLSFHAIADDIADAVSLLISRQPMKVITGSNEKEHR